MKKWITIICLLSTSILFAHESSVPLKQNQIKTSLFWAATGGAQYFNAFGFDENNKMNEIVVLAQTTEFDYSLGASVFLFEYGFCDYFSVGINLSLVELFTHKVLYDNWTLYGAPFIRFSCPGTFLGNPDVNMHFVSKLFLSPIFSLPVENKSDWIADGLINMFNTFSFNYRFLKGKKISVHAYIDLKHISTFVNENYRSLAFDFDPVFEAFNYTEEDIENISIGIGGVHKIAIAPGVELEWGVFNLHLGFNFTLFKYSTDAKYFERTSTAISDISLSNLDLGWSFRF